MDSSGRRLRLAWAHSTISVPGVFNPLLAMMAEEIGFRAVYLSGGGFSAGNGLPDVGLLTLTEIGRSQVEKETSQGVGNLSELMPAKPRMFNDAELRAAAEEKIVLDCECPRHLSELIKSLNEFETYSSACSVDNWKDAAIHASIYAYTCQARHLMEKALQSALEGRTLNVEATPQPRRA